MATAELITRMTQLIVEAARPLQVILFGSHARGEAGPHSDVDFLVIVPEGRDRKQTRWDVLDALRPCGTAAYDVVVSTLSEMARRGDLVGNVFRPALRDGKLLYDAATGFRSGDSQEAPCLEVRPVTDDLRLEETRDWLQRAERDLRAAYRLLERDPDPGLACYHCQQAAEKALKAVLIFLQIDYPFTHKLDEIRDRVPEEWPLKAQFPDLEVLSGWSFKGRYPGPWEDPDLVDAERALAEAEDILRAVLRDLEAHGFQR